MFKHYSLSITSQAFFVCFLLLLIISFPHCAQAIDISPPSTPVVTDDGDISYGNCLHASWISTDLESGISGYEITISTTPNETGILSGLGWKDVGSQTEITSPGLSLVNNHTYYILVKAINGDGVESAIGASNGIKARLAAYGSDLFPLYVGGVIYYDVLDNGSKKDGFIKVTDSAMVSGQKRYTIELSLVDDMTWVLSKLSDGYYMYSQDGVNFPTPIKKLVQPVSVNDTWQYSESPGSVTTNLVISTDESVTVPAGSFIDSVLVKITWSDWPGEYGYQWFVPGVGLVKIAYYDSDDEIYESEEMTGWLVKSTILSNDTTPPTTPVVTDDGTTSYGNCLHGKWSSSDPQSGISEYMVGISTTPNESGILPDVGWISVGTKTEDTSPGLSLVDGQTYYILVKAKNDAELWSNVGVSNGIVVKLKKPGNDYWPLSLGFKATFDVSNTNIKGTMSIDSTKIIKNITTYVINYDMVDPDSKGYIAFAKLNGATCAYGSADLNLNWTIQASPQIWIPAVLTQGYKWSYLENTGEWIDAEIISSTETLTIPAGTFTNCLKVKRIERSSNDYWYTWNAPGVGFVKFLDGADGWEMSSYMLKVNPDTTPPTKPVVTLGSSVISGSTVSASWISTDAESGISEYQAAISTSANASGILNGTDWESFGTATSGDIENSSLQVGSKYYVVVRAQNGDGLWSPVGASASFTVTKAIGSVVINPSDKQVKAGAKQKFTAKVYDENNNEMIGKKVTWTYDSGSISTAGIYTAPKVLGNYHITATVVGSQIKDEVNVEVIPGEPGKVTIDPLTVNIVGGDNQEFTAKVYDSFNNEITDAVIKWSVKTAKAGTISSDGNFTAGLIAGKYIGAIVAACGTKKVAATVTVVPPPPSKIEITPEINQIAAGAKQKFTAKAYDDKDNLITGFKFAWSVSSSSIGKISNGTFIAAKIPGSGSINVVAMLGTAVYGNPGSLEIEIVPGAPSKVVVSEPSITLAFGASHQFSAQVFDKYNNLVDADVTWSLSNVKAGTLDANGGFTAGNAAGTYYVLAKLGKVTGKAKVKVVKL